MHLVQKHRTGRQGLLQHGAVALHVRRIVAHM